MRILMTTDTVGGVWTFTKQLATELLDRGHEIALVSFGRAPSPSQAQWAVDVGSLRGSAFSYLPCEAPLEWMQNNERAYDTGAPLLLCVADEFQPDILLSSQFCFGKLPVAAQRVVVAHSDVLSWARSCRSAPLPSSDWLTQYVTLVGEGLGTADAVVAPTHWMLSALGANFTLPQHSVVILNGRSVACKEGADVTRKLQAATAGRFWDEGKNLKVLNGLCSPIPIVIAGSFELESGVATVDSTSVTLLGELSEAGLLSVFRGSSIYICTSIYEPFGLAPLEAALCGCAVVANDIPSLREVWADCALYFNGPSELTAQLDWLRDREHLTRAQQRAVERARMFSASRMAERYLNLFERLLHSDTFRTSVHAA